MTERDVADWMLEQVQINKYLSQGSAVYEIDDMFGDKFTYQNENGNLAIGKGVLKEFKKISGDSVVWDKYDKAWRLRDGDDQPGRQQS